MNLQNRSQPCYQKSRRILYIYQGQPENLQTYILTLSRIFPKSKIVLGKRSDDPLDSVPKNVSIVEIDLTTPWTSVQLKEFRSLLEGVPWDVTFVQGISDHFLADSRSPIRWFGLLKEFHKKFDINYLSSHLEVQNLNEVIGFWAGPVTLAKAGLVVERPGVSSGSKLDALYELVMKRPKKDVVVEIGRYFGRSTLAIAHAIKASGSGKLISIDPVLQAGILEAMEEEGLSSFVEIWNQTSGKAHGRWCKEKGGQTIGMIFVDGDHSYEEASADIHNWSSHLVPDGIMAVDDYTSEYPGVLKAVNETILWSDKFYDIQFKGDLIIARKK